MPAVWAIGSSLSQLLIHWSSEAEASEVDGAEESVAGNMARSFSISVSPSSPKSDDISMGNDGEEVMSKTGVRRMALRSVSADVDDEGEEAWMRKGEEVREDGDEVVAAESVVVLSLESRMERSQSSVFAWAGEMVVGVWAVNEEQTGKSEAIWLTGEIVLVSKRLVRALFPPAAGTSHRPMKGTRCTPPVLGGEWKRTPKRLPTAR